MAGPINFDQMKQQQTFMSMHGAQLAEQAQGKKTELGAMPKAKGSKKQLVGTVVGILVVAAVLFILNGLT